MKITIMFASLLWLAIVQLLGTASADDQWYHQVGSGCDWRRTGMDNWRICNPPIQPNFYPNTGFSKVFTVMVKIDGEFDSSYYNKHFKSLSIGDWPYKSLDAVSHVYGNLYFRAIGKEERLVKRAEFGPLWMRRTTETNNDYRMFWKLPGFTWYNRETGWASFRFFIDVPTDGPGSDSIINGWRSFWYGKTSYDMGVSLTATCMNGFYTNETTEATKPLRCETQETPISTNPMDHYAMKVDDVSQMTGRVEKAELKSNSFELVYRWSAADVQLYNKDRIRGEESQRPQLRVFLFDSNPAPHGQAGVSEERQKNIKVRAVLAMFPYYPSWDDAHNKTQETYSFDLGWGGWKEEVTDFLWKYAANDRQGQDSAYYAGWNTSTGLSMAISMCMKTGYQETLDYGCREWQTHPVTILDRSPQPTHPE